MNNAGCRQLKILLSPQLNHIDHFFRSPCHQQSTKLLLFSLPTAIIYSQHAIFHTTVQLRSVSLRRLSCQDNCDQDRVCAEKEVGKMQYYQFKLLLCLLCIQRSFSIPFYDDPDEFNCPVGRRIESSEVTESGRLIDLAKTEGHKIRIRFYTPTTGRSLKDKPEEATLGFPYFVSVTNDTVRNRRPIKRERVIEEETTTVVPTTTTFPRRLRNVFCQWEFKAANESDYLLLTFNNLSAPYSVDCSEAYVALQKDNGYESRWCGNRRQANSRPMSLFSKTGAKIRVLRKANAPLYPATGFTVTVESVDLVQISGVENSLRVLLG